MYFGRCITHTCTCTSFWNTRTFVCVCVHVYMYVCLNFSPKDFFFLKKDTLTNGIAQTEVVLLTHLLSSLSIPLFHPHRLAPTSPTPTKTDFQSAPQYPDNDSETKEPLQLYGHNEEEESEDEEDISDQTSPLKEEQRSVSWPGSLPNHLLKFPTVVDRASLRAQTTTTMAATSTGPFSQNPVPLWALGSSTVKPIPVASGLSVTSTSPATSISPSVIYSMLPSQGVGLPPMLTPLLTFMPSGALMSGAGLANTTQPVVITPKKPTSLPTLPHTSKPIHTSTTPSPQGRESRSSLSSPQMAFSAEPSSGQPMESPIGEQMRIFSPIPPQRTLASIPPSEMTPQYMELKAFAEEFKTKRIRLGYTQGSVGQSLAQKGYSNFAQSTISRFEQMQLSATNAAAIKQVLEKWLQETEFPESVTSSSSDPPIMTARKRKRRAVFTPQTKSTLDEFFRQNPRPNRQAIDSIAQQLDLLPEEVRVWFCNKRQKQKQSSSSTSSCYSITSPTSSGLVSLGSPSFSPKQRSPSPKTSFTIEELSKSSTATSTSICTSPIRLTSPFSISPTTLSLSTTGGPMFMPATTFSHLKVTQTRA